MKKYFLVGATILMAYAPAWAEFELGMMASEVIGQQSLASGYQDRADQYTRQNSLWSPEEVSVCGDWMFVADYSNDRVLRFSRLPGGEFADLPDLVLGQPDFNSNNINHPKTASDRVMSSPSSLSCDGASLYVSNWSWNRVLIYRDLSDTGLMNGADIVLGQGGMGSSGASSERNGMKNPRQVHVAGGKLFVADANNNRVMIWNSTAALVTGQAADVILNSSRARGTSPILMDYPFGVASDGQHLAVADRANRRILLWNSVPLADDVPADACAGQADCVTVATGTPVSATTYYVPSGVRMDAGHLAVYDTGWHRILIYDTDWTGSQPSLAYKMVLGQPNPNAAATNPLSYFHNPYGFWTEDWSTFYVGDTSHHRVLKVGGSWEQVFGQEDYSRQSPNRGPREDGLNTPGGVAAIRSLSQDLLAVSDSNNHRVLIFNKGNYSVPMATLGQAGPEAYFYDGEPRVNTLDYPRGVGTDGHRLYVADSSNNRVLYWNLSQGFTDQRPADGVIGQQQFTSQNSDAGSLASPTGVYSDGEAADVGGSQSALRDQRSGRAGPAEQGERNGEPAGRGDARDDAVSQGCLYGRREAVRRGWRKRSDSGMERH